MFEKEASPKFRSRTLWIIITGFISMYLTSAISQDCINVIQPAFMEKFGMNSTQVTMPVTIGAYVVIIAAFFYSTIIMKKGVRMFGVVCSVILAVSTALVGLAYNVDGTVAVVLMAVGLFFSRAFVMAVQLCVMQVCANWFMTTRGRVMGIIMAGCAVDNATAQTVSKKMAAAIGFGATYYVIAGLLLVMAVLIYLFFVTTPEEAGFTPDGIVRPEKEMEQLEEGEYHTKWTLKKLFSLPESWTIMIGFGIYSMAITCSIAVFSIRMDEVGISPALYGVLLLAAGVCGILAGPIYGVIIDKLGAPKAGAVLGICDMLMMVGLAMANAQRVWPVYLAAFGVAMMAGTPAVQPALTIHVFGPKEYQAANRYLSIVVNLISACALLYMSVIHDITGSYTMAYIVMTMLCAISAVAMMAIKNTHE